MPHSPRTGPVTHHVAARLRDLRERAGLSTPELARRLTASGWPTTQPTVTKTEMGQRRIDVEELAALALVLGVRPADLLPPAPPDAREDGTPKEKEK
ncbi:Helix-turn-helix domain-containing protein [Streptomyces sp. WMMB 714]|uniref:helix-turn-helix domain-containing protein n=1 Tax=Streptomyces sp. WMMB 714 TaxID=1286822 RepID=UPI000696B360|nr:helix-turn-helix transcriptional regulator [Streptomyces sp. WMMB 714]SCK37291.1 Helix-turn-helix domain-containing protein [Streptomyces sp. WMMB 714]